MHVAAAEAAIVVVFGHWRPAGMTLTGDVGLPGVALSVEGIELSAAGSPTLISCYLF
jgi:hypothetical protein